MYSRATSASTARSRLPSPGNAPPPPPRREVCCVQESSSDLIFPNISRLEFSNVFWLSFVPRIEKLKQKASEIKSGIDGAEALVPFFSVTKHISVQTSFPWNSIDLWYLKGGVCFLQRSGNYLLYESTR